MNSFAEGLKNNTNLTCLDLRNNILTGNLHILVEALYANKTLKSLVLNNSQLKDSDIISFCGLLLMENSLTSIDFGNFSQTKKEMTLLKGSNSLSDEGCKSLCNALAINKTLTEVNVSGTFLTDNSYKFMGQALKSKFLFWKEFQFP